MKYKELKVIKQRPAANPSKPSVILTALTEETKH